MDDRATLASALSGRYDIDREIGRGGMATVYLARDVRHDRRVALKLLNPELGAVLGVERFLSEIRVTANLQHPNLLPLFDSGEANGLLFYVMPYIDGESLRARLDRDKQLPIDEAVRIATAIASALDYAHRHGVIHRDLKPENILLHDGQPLVADFGIALAVSNAGGARVTQTGLSLGTPQYMSPEQATGDRGIDSRTDIYSLGALTYEMLAGEPPHSGATAQAIIARLMTEEPRPLSTVRRSVPPHVEAAVRCALEKLPADRFATAKEFGDALQGRGAALPSLTSAGSATLRLGQRARVASVAAALLSIVATAAGIGWWRAAHTTPRSVRFVVDAPPGQRIDDSEVGVALALSPDGRTVAFNSATDGHVYLQRLDQLESVRLSMVTGAWDFRFSPDSKWLGFKDRITISKAPVNQGDTASSPTKLLDILGFTGFAWLNDAEITYPYSASLRRAPSAPDHQMVAPIDTTIARWSGPYVFADRKTIAVKGTPRGHAYGTAGDRLVIASTNGTSDMLDLEVQNVIGYIDGTLIYGALGGRVMGVRFDVASRKVSGEPVSLVEGVAFKATSGVTASLGDDGSLAYMIGATTSVIEMLDERGVVVATLPQDRRYTSLSISRDGKRIALYGTENGTVDVWVYDLASRVMSRFTRTGDAFGPAWSADGTRIGFMSAGRMGQDARGVFSAAADGSGTLERIPGSTSRNYSQIEFSPDGKYVVVTRASPTGRDSVRVQTSALPLSKTGVALPLIESAHTPRSVAVSPGSRWLAYIDDESGRDELYIR
ncbi:hypothetical protein BH09GEM1_BH09GEM1_41030 [soil metagenome]